jgi:hypothetical protein
MPKNKWVKPDSQFATGSRGRVTQGIVKRREDKKAETDFKARVVPAKSKDKLTNKRR